MAIPSVYINLEDDVSRVVTRLGHQSARQVVLVCPKRCFLFSDSINLRLLKKQTDLLGKEVFILTMDERGQFYAKEAGFGLKFLPKNSGSRVMSDVRMPQKPLPAAQPEPETGEPGVQQKAEDDLGSAAGAIWGMGTIARQSPHPFPDTLPKETEISSSVVAEPPVEPAPQVQPEPDIPVAVTESFFPAEIQDEYKDQPKKSHSSKIISALVALSLILILLLVFVVLPRAEVVVYPKAEVLTRDMDITISSNAAGIDPQKLVIPATKVDDTISASDNFTSQGKMQVGNKAQGTVQIYNFTKLPITLRAATTVLMVGTQTYSLVNDAVDLKPTGYKDASTKEVDPNSLGSPIEIIATQGGDDYNLPAGTRLEIINQVFGSRPQLLYAKSFTDIDGGTTRYLSLISQDDITGAQKQLQTEALGQERQRLQAQGLVLADGAYSETVSQFSTDNPVGTQTPSFNASSSAQITGLAFKQSDLNSTVYQRISQSLSSDQTLQTGNSAQITYVVNNLDLTNGLAVLATHFQGEGVFNVNVSNLAPELTGKSQSQVNEILSSQAEIDSVQITLAPAWQKNFPLFAGKINLSVASATPISTSN